MFRTNFDDSALFYAAGGDQGIDHYISVSICNNSVHVNMDFGDEPTHTILGKHANLTQWNNLTVFHEYNRVHLSLNNERVTVNISHNAVLYIDPEIYIAGGPD